MKPSVLISTLPLKGGGVTAHVNYVTRLLTDSGYDVTVAYYEPFSECPELSVPCWKLTHGRIGKRCRMVGETNVVELGCWLPELEFTNYFPTRYWKELIAAHTLLVAVSGTALAALPFALESRRFLAWVGTPFEPDRKDRIDTFPWYRRVLDSTLNRRVCRHFEKTILNTGVIVPTTKYVKTELELLAGRTIADPIGVPVDVDYFTPSRDEVVPYRLAFTGRYNDPRKNIPLLIDVLRRCRERGCPATLELIGDTPSAEIARYIDDSGMTPHVIGLHKAALPELRAAYRAASVFVIPSHQEGLCVSGLEAMASGCPVVSTACGGPADYIEQGSNGYLAQSNPDSIADKVLEIMSSDATRQRFAGNARSTIEARYSAQVVDKTFMAEFNHVFQGRDRYN